MFRLFGDKRNKEDWAEVYSTMDLWEAELIRSALLNENIRANVKSLQGEERGTQRNVVSVPAAKVTEAKMVIRRTSIVISKKDDILAEQAEREKTALQMTAEDYRQDDKPATVEIKPDSEPVIIAEKDGRPPASTVPANPQPLV